MSEDLTMPAAFMDEVPIVNPDGSPGIAPVPPFRKVRYQWDSHLADWMDPVKRPLLDWAVRKNCRPGVNIAYLYNGNPVDLVPVLNEQHASQQTQGIEQDLIPIYGAGKVIPAKPLHLISEAEWQSELTFLNASLDHYWAQLAASNADETKAPSVIIFNGIETVKDPQTGAKQAFFDSFRNPDCAGLSWQQRQAWDHNLANFYAAAHHLIWAKFPNSKILFFKAQAHSWGGKNDGGRVMLPPDRNPFGWSVQNYQPEGVDFAETTMIREVQAVDNLLSGQQQGGRRTLPPGDEFAGDFVAWLNPGHSMAFEMQYRSPVQTSIKERLSHHWREAFLMEDGGGWVGREYRADEARFGPYDRISEVCYWPKLFNQPGTDWTFLARLLGAANIKSDGIILQEAI